MTPARPLRSNFAHLVEHDEQLLRLGILAEQYFPEDPNTSLIKPLATVEAKRRNTDRKLCRD